MSNVSPTPTGGWYADPRNAEQLRWWDGQNWTEQTTAGSDVESVAPVTPITAAPEAGAPAMPGAEDAPGIYIPRNSVFKMADAVAGTNYTADWWGLADISDEIALSGVPVQLALEATPSDGPPIPVSADAFPILGLPPEPELELPRAEAPWQVDQPLGRPIEDLFPISGPESAAPPPVVAPLPNATPLPSRPAAESFGLSSVSFPNSAPEADLSVAPVPTGAIFPGLVPIEPEPTLDSWASVPVLTAVPQLVSEPIAIVQQLAEPQRAEQQTPEELHAQQPDPQPGRVAAPTAPEGFATDAPSTAHADEAVQTREIPLPTQFGAAPTITAPPAPTDMPAIAPPAPALPPSTETPWPAAGTYQPHPGNYVPFDPNALVNLEPVPPISFGSRDPFEPARTSRPGLRFYGAAPIGPNGSTYTPALALIWVTPLLLAAGYSLLFQLQSVNVGLAPNLALAALLAALFFVGIGAAQFDRNSLAKRGYFDLASPFWILLSPLVYLGVRASRLHSQGPGGIRAVFLWFAAWLGAAAVLVFSTFTAIAAVTPDRVAQTESSIAQALTVDKVVPTVNCAGIPSFASGSVFNCTAASPDSIRLVQVTITNWKGGESYRVISKTSTAPAAAAPAS